MEVFENVILLIK